VSRAHIPVAALKGLLNRDFTAKSEASCKYSAAVGQNSSLQQHPMQQALSLRKTTKNHKGLEGSWLIAGLLEIQAQTWKDPFS